MLGGSRQLVLSGIYARLLLLQTHFKINLLVFPVLVSVGGLWPLVLKFGSQLVNQILQKVHFLPKAITLVGREHVTPTIFVRWLLWVALLESLLKLQIL